MIGRFLGLVVRVLLESGVLLIVAGCLLLVLAFRASRRLVVSSPDPLERLSGPLARALQLIPKPPVAADGDTVDS